MDKDKEKKNNKKWARWSAIFAAVLDVAIIITLIVSLVITKDKLAKVNSRLVYLSDNTDIIMTDVGNLHSEFEAMLEEEASLIESWGIDVVDTDFEAGTYKVKINIIPKEYTDETKTVVYFGTNEIPLELMGFQYVGEAELPLEETYEKNVTVLFNDGSKRRTEQLSNFDGLVNDFNDVLAASTDKAPTYVDGMLKLAAPIAYELDGRDEFIFNSFNLIIEADGEEIIDFDVMESNGAVRKNSSAEADEEGLEPETEEIKETEVIEHKEPEKFSVVSGSFISNEGVEISQGSNVRIFLRAVSQEGFVFEYDVFTGVTKQSEEEEQPVEGFEDSKESFASHACVFDNKGGKLEL